MSNRRFTPPTNDPWRGLRGVMAGTLILELIVVLLAYPVIAKVAGGVTVASGIYIGLIALLLLLGSGVQGRSWALGFDLAIQVLLIVGAWIHWSVAAVGVVFGMVWLYIVYVRRDVQRRMDNGLLFGQQPVDGTGAAND